MERGLPQRSRPAHHPVLDVPNRSSVVFVTVCAKDRKLLLARPEIHVLLVAAWHSADTWKVGRYVMMPDHIHFFCTPAGKDAPPLTAWVRYWKAAASRAWPHRTEQPIWQDGFWDRQLRQSESYGEKWEYVRQNPVRAGLAVRPEDWPFAGELNLFRFHDA